MSQGRNPVPDLMRELQASLAEFQAAKAAAHPDITDALGRVWVWWKGDLYLHDNMAWTADMITRPEVGLPSDAVMLNPNYTWC